MVSIIKLNNVFTILSNFHMNLNTQNLSLERPLSIGRSNSFCDSILNKNKPLNQRDNYNNSPSLVYNIFTNEEEQERQERGNTIINLLLQMRASQDEQNQFIQNKNIVKQQIYEQINRELLFGKNKLSPSKVNQIKNIILNTDIDNTKINDIVQSISIELKKNQVYDVSKSTFSFNNNFTYNNYNKINFLVNKNVFNKYSKSYIDNLKFVNNVLNLQSHTNSSYLNNKSNHFSNNYLNNINNHFDNTYLNNNNYSNDNYLNNANNHFSNNYLMDLKEYFNNNYSTSEFNKYIGNNVFKKYKNTFLQNLNSRNNNVRLNNITNTNSILNRIKTSLGLTYNQHNINSQVKNTLEQIFNEDNIISNFKNKNILNENTNSNNILNKYYNNPNYVSELKVFKNTIDTISKEVNLVNLKINNIDLETNELTKETREIEKKKLLTLLRTKVEKIIQEDIINIENKVSRTINNKEMQRYVDISEKVINKYNQLSKQVINETSSNTNYIKLINKNTTSTNNIFEKSVIFNELEPIVNNSNIIKSSNILKKVLRNLSFTKNIVNSSDQETINNYSSKLNLLNYINRHESSNYNNDINNYNNINVYKDKNIISNMQYYNDMVEQAGQTNLVLIRDGKPISRTAINRPNKNFANNKIIYKNPIKIPETLSNTELNNNNIKDMEKLLESQMIKKPISNNAHVDNYSNNNNFNGNTAQQSHEAMTRKIVENYVNDLDINVDAISRKVLEKIERTLKTERRRFGMTS